MPGEPATLPRQLSLFDGAALVVGSVIGGGVFLVPAVIARAVPSSSAFLLVWVIAGALSFCGALAFAELGAMMPSTGGQYVFLREAYGPLWGFLCSWTMFLVIMAAQIASLSIGFALYLGYFVSMPPLVAKASACGLIAIVTWINVRGTQAGAGVQKTFLILKLTGIAILIASAFLSRQPSHLHLEPISGIGWGAAGLAMAPCLLAYDGWNMISFIAGEMKRPQRNLPLALGLGVGAVVLVYVLLNVAFLRVLPLPEIAASERVGAAVAERTIGPIGGGLVALTIILSIVGSLNGAVLAPPRLYFAQARDGLFFHLFGVVHPRFRTPAWSILIQGIWATLLAITGTYEKLIGLAIFASWVFYALTVAGLLVLRRTRPDQPRPYRMWGYPVTTVAFVAAAVWFVVNFSIQSPSTALLGVLLIATGIPVYFVWRRRSNRISHG